jgi:hypothetical protein
VVAVEAGVDLSTSSMKLTQALGQFLLLGALVELALWATELAQPGLTELRA